MSCFAIAWLTACNSGDSKKEEPATTTKEVAAAPDNSTNPDYQKGLELVAKNKCMTCHTIETALVGPPYRDVANKYAGSADTMITHLAKKVISGGKGVWGEVLMTPHPDVTLADAEAMVKYIMLLKK